jgi:predicted acyltransferase (DUF342 family)
VIFGDVWVSDTVQVYGNARLYGIVEAYDNAHIYGDAQISGSAKVYGNAQVFGYTKISGYVEAYDNARIFSEGWITGNIQVYGDAIVTKVVNTIFTDEYDITITDNFIAIGCKNHSIEDWESFTDEQINDMDTEALKWWRVWKPIIFAITKAY